MLYIIYKVKISIYNFFMRLRYGYAWSDVWHLNFAIGNRIVKLLKKYIKTHKFNTETLDIYTDIKDLIYLFNTILELSDTHLPRFFNDKLTDSTIYDYIYSQYNKRAIDCLKYIDDKNLIELYKFINKVLSRWLKEGVSSYPDDFTTETWVSELKVINNEIKSALKDNNLRGESLNHLFKYLPDMWN